MICTALLLGILADVLRSPCEFLFLDVHLCIVMLLIAIFQPANSSFADFELEFFSSILLSLMSLTNH